MDITVIGRILTFIALLAVPQLLGLLVHFRMKKHSRLAHFVGFAITMVSSLSVLQLIFAPKTETEMCGLGTLAAMIFILFFAVVQAVVSIAAQIWFRNKYRS